LFKYEYEEGRVKKTKKMMILSALKFLKYFVLFLMKETKRERRYLNVACSLGRPISLSLSFHTSHDDDDTKAR